MGLSHLGDAWSWPTGGRILKSLALALDQVAYGALPSDEIPWPLSARGRLTYEELAGELCDLKLFYVRGLRVNLTRYGQKCQKAEGAGELLQALLRKITPMELVLTGIALGLRQEGQLQTWLLAHHGISVGQVELNRQLSLMVEAQWLLDDGDPGNLRLTPEGAEVFRRANRVSMGLLLAANGLAKLKPALTVGRVPKLICGCAQHKALPGVGLSYRAKRQMTRAAVTPTALRLFEMHEVLTPEARTAIAMWVEELFVASASLKLLELAEWDFKWRTNCQIAKRERVNSRVWQNLRRAKGQLLDYMGPILMPPRLIDSNYLLGNSSWSAEPSPKTQLAKRSDAVPYGLRVALLKLRRPDPPMSYLGGPILLPMKPWAEGGGLTLEGEREALLKRRASTQAEELAAALSVDPLKESFTHRTLTVTFKPIVSEAPPIREWLTEPCRCTVQKPYVHLLVNNYNQAHSIVRELFSNLRSPEFKWYSEEEGKSLPQEQKQLETWWLYDRLGNGDVKAFRSGKGTSLYCSTTCYRTEVALRRAPVALNGQKKISRSALEQYLRATRDIFPEWSADPIKDFEPVYWDQWKEPRGIRSESAPGAFPLTGGAPNLRFVKAAVFKGSAGVLGRIAQAVEGVENTPLIIVVEDAATGGDRFYRLREYACPEHRGADWHFAGLPSVGSVQSDEEEDEF